jgi:hypothetical protein
MKSRYKDEAQYQKQLQYQREHYQRNKIEIKIRKLTKYFTENEKPT